MKKKVYLGVDVGSISINLLVIDSNDTVLFDSYIRGQGNPIAAVQKGLKELEQNIPDDVEISGVCVTGSGRSLIGAVVGADIIKNEIMAHARAAIHLHPDVQTILEIGGQDSKVTIIRDGVVVDFAMNLVCAAGTGSFLDSQAKRLDISIDELSNKSVLSENPTDISGRCTVFAESDMIHKQQVGHKQEDILMGLCHAMVRNYLSNVCRGKEIKTPILLQGGISANKGIGRAFSEALKADITIPQYNMVMGAFGAALIAKNATIKQTRFRGFDIADHSIATGSFKCKDCSNLCEVIEILDSNEVIGRSGGRCGKWENSYETT
ncbi:MAG: 2-hydroxyglutaryl-CoA dehydratase [Spirochaetes bacterium RIFOXYB1_FULL_32_8]|nr:MAG: 2-hydroxyglutaryl-CoA dehydratase [Spirochaetes bacterium RIFOXYB1_FULL_32_8]